MVFLFDDSGEVEKQEGQEESGERFFATDGTRDPGAVEMRLGNVRARLKPGQ